MYEGEKCRRKREVASSEREGEVNAKEDGELLGSLRSVNFAPFPELILELFQSRDLHEDMT